MNLSLRILLVLAVLLPVTHAQRGVHQRPDPESGPTEVQVGIYINDILKVDGAEQLLTVDFFLTQRWRDPSLAGGQTRAVSPADVWAPNVVVVNEGRLFSKLPNLVEIDAEGNLRMTQRYVGTLTNRLPLFDFPFDEQSFRIQVASGQSASEVLMRNATESTGQRPEFTLTDWAVEQGQTIDMPYDFAPSGATFVGLAYEMPARRLLAYYLWKGLVPLGLVVLMAFSVFWIDPTQLGPRLSVAVTSMLTLIAYRFLLGGLLPRLSYLTRMDWYTLSCTTLVFVTLVTVVASAYLTRTGREEVGTRIERLARSLFPLAFIASFAASFVL